MYCYKYTYSKHELRARVLEGNINSYETFTFFVVYCTASEQYVPKINDLHSYDRRKA